MMQSYRVALFGHEDLYHYNKLEARLCAFLQQLFSEKGCLEIYLGRNSDFDIIALSAVKRVKELLGEEKILLVLALPYKERGGELYERDYDRVVLLGYPREPYLKGPFIKRDRFMIEESDLTVCYVEHESDLAHLALQYADKTQKKNLNLARVRKKDWMKYI